MDAATANKEFFKEGRLRKEGGSIKSWKTRWCVIEDNHLLYYKNEKKRELKGSISLKVVSKVGPVNYRKKKFCFEMVTPDRDYHITATSTEEMDDWVAALKKNLDWLNAAKSAAATNGGTVKGANSTATNGDKEKDFSFASTPAAEGEIKPKVNDFESLNVIGRGSFGKVLQVKHIPTGNIYAMKVLNKKSIIDRGELEHTKAEQSILTKLNCPFLVRLHWSFQTTDKLYFVMDFVNGGELFFHLQKEKSFNAKRVQFYSAEIVLGLEYLHKMGVIYRDLKPENILLTNQGHICMTDFGISKEGLTAKDSRTATFCGTPEYLAPEVLKGQQYGKEVDWWSLGTLIYEMLTGLPPFYSEDVQLMYSKIMKEKLNFPKKMTEEAKSLITALLERNPSDRLSDPEQIKRHPYFANLDWDRLSRKELEPPYIPPVKDEKSTTMISSEFTSEDAKLSLVEDSAIKAGAGDQPHIPDFTFVAPSKLAK